MQVRRSCLCFEVSGHALSRAPQSWFSEALKCCGAESQPRPPIKSSIVRTYRCTLSNTQFYLFLPAALAESSFALRLRAFFCSNNSALGALWLELKPAFAYSYSRLTQPNLGRTVSIVYSAEYRYKDIDVLRYLIFSYLAQNLLNSGGSQQKYCDMPLISEHYGP
jgi:hypothetical protein